MKCPAEHRLSAIQSLRHIFNGIDSPAKPSLTCMIWNADCRKNHHQLFDSGTASRRRQTRHKTALAFPKQNQVFRIYIGMLADKIFHRQQVLYLCQDRHFRALSIAFESFVLGQTPAPAKAKAVCHIANVSKIPAPVFHICIIAQEAVAGNDGRIVLPLIKVFWKILHSTDGQPLSAASEWFLCYRHVNNLLSYLTQIVFHSILTQISCLFPCQTIL